MTLRSVLLSLAVVVAFPAISLAQQVAPTWQWTWDGDVFFGLNHQDRRYVDRLGIAELGDARRRPAGAFERYRFTVMGMLSLEPFTMDKQVRRSSFRRRELQADPARQLSAPGSSRSTRPA